MGFVSLTERIREAIAEFARRRGAPEAEVVDDWLADEAPAFLAAYFGGETLPPDSPHGRPIGERRRAPRISMELPVHFRVVWTPDDGRAGEEIGATAENVSAVGLYVLADRPWAPGTLVHVEFPWPGAEAPISAVALVTWRRAMPDGRWGLGLGFCYVEPRSSDRIAEKVLAFLADAEVAA